MIARHQAGRKKSVITGSASSGLVTVALTCVRLDLAYRVLLRCVQLDIIFNSRHDMVLGHALKAPGIAQRRGMGCI